jgi:hypothetical protein
MLTTRKHTIRKFSELEAKMGAERIARSNERVKKMMAEMPLNELREARRLTQAQLAVSMEVEQSEVSRIERRTDVYVSTLGRMIEAMGGRLEIRACFPEGTVVINQFSDV